MKRALFLSLFLIVSLILSLRMLNRVYAPDPIRHWIDLELGNLYGFRGESINLTAYSSRDVLIQIRDPTDALIYNQTWDGNTSRLLPIQNQAPYGEYEISGTLPNATSYTWFNVVDFTGFVPASFPFLRLHNNAEYWVFANRTFRMNSGGKSYGFTLPDLPDAVNINCFNNSDIFVVRFTSGVVNIDLSLVFVHAGAKIVINGTMQGGFNSFRFPFFSPQQIRRWVNGFNIRTPERIGVDPAPLYFDWSDFRRAGEHISWDQATHTLTVFDVPETFWLDPVIGNNVIEADTESYPNYDEGNRHQVLDGDGNITSFSIYCEVSSGSHDIGVAIYDDDATDPDNLLFNASRTISHTDPRWENFTVSPQIQVTNASFVHLMHNKEASVIVYQNATEGEADPNSVYDYRAYGMPFPDPFPPDASHNDHAYMFSIYADYVVSGAQAFSYVLSETFAVTASTILGIERAFSGSESGTISDSLLLLQAKIWGFENPTVLLSSTEIGLEMAFATYTILETFNIESGLLMLQERLFGLDNPTLVTSSSTLGIEASFVSFTIWETFVIIGEASYSALAEITLNDVFAIASLALILSLCAISYGFVKHKRNSVI